MSITHLVRAVALTAAVLVPATEVDASAPPSVSMIDPDGPSQSTAMFEGAKIDLGEGWGEAKACAVTDTEVRCFRTEATMDRYLAMRERRAAADAPANTVGGGFAASAASTTCSSSLRLYDGTSFTGSVLSVAIRWSVLSLWRYGFDNRTSSFRVGACGVDFFSGSSGGGSAYSGATWAGGSAASMGYWDNVVSSIYIY
jgi:hypothetical protein